MLAAAHLQQHLDLVDVAAHAQLARCLDSNQLLISCHHFDCVSNRQQSRGAYMTHSITALLAANRWYPDNPTKRLCSRVLYNSHDCAETPTCNAHTLTLLNSVRSVMARRVKQRQETEELPLRARGVCPTIALGHRKA